MRSEDQVYTCIQTPILLCEVPRWVEADAQVAGAMRYLCEDEASKREVGEETGNAG